MQEQVLVGWQDREECCDAVVHFSLHPLPSWSLLEMHGIWGLAGWQWMFIIEAIPAIILGVVVFKYMTDRPELNPPR
jgi:sugar phosphate permease